MTPQDKDPADITDPVQAAVARSAAAAVILDRHKGALFPHLAMLHETFGPVILRAIVSGAVEATIIAAQRNGGRVPPIGDDALLDHRVEPAPSATIIGFPGERSDG